MLGAAGMSGFVEQNGIVRYAIMESLEFRHLHEIAGRCVEGPVTAMANIDPEIGAKPVRLLDPLVICQDRQLWRRVAIDLRAVENGVSAGKDAMMSCLLISFPSSSFCC